MTNGLGFLPYSNSPHHDAEEQRRPAIHRLIGDGTLPEGYATDNGTGLVFEGTDLVDCITEIEGARTWHITRRPDGTVEETALPDPPACVLTPARLLARPDPAACLRPERAPDPGHTGQ